jgi:hypothetical protein
MYVNRWASQDQPNLQNVQIWEVMILRYRRADVTRGTYFFTVNLANRESDLLTRHIDVLREVVNKARRLG